MNPTRMTALLCAVLVGLSATAAHAVDQYWQDIRTQTKAGPLTVAIEWEGVAEFGGGMVYQHIQADASGPIRGTTGWRVGLREWTGDGKWADSTTQLLADLFSTVKVNRVNGLSVSGRARVFYNIDGDEAYRTVGLMKYKSAFASVEPWFDKSMDHTRTRYQVGIAPGDFRLFGQKIGLSVAYLYQVPSGSGKTMDAIYSVFTVKL